MSYELIVLAAFVGAVWIAYQLGVTVGKSRQRKKDALWAQVERETDPAKRAALAESYQKIP
jgi:hypothetical protein